MNRVGLLIWLGEEEPTGLFLKKLAGGTQSANTNKL